MSSKFIPPYKTSEFKWANRPPGMGTLGVEVSLSRDNPVVRLTDYSDTSHPMSIEHATMLGRALIAAAQFAQDNVVPKSPVITAPTKPKKGNK